MVILALAVGAMEARKHLCSLQTRQQRVTLYGLLSLCVAQLVVQSCCIAIGLRGKALVLLLQLDAHTYWKTCERMIATWRMHAAASRRTGQQSILHAQAALQKSLSG